MPSNNSFRGLRLAHKAGYFFSPAQGEYAPINRRPAITEPLFEEVTPAKVDCWTAVVGGPLAFCPPTNVQQSHVSHRNSHPRRAAKTPPNSQGFSPAPIDNFYTSEVAFNAGNLQLIH